MPQCKVCLHEIAFGQSFCQRCTRLTHLPPSRPRVCEDCKQVLPEGLEGKRHLQAHKNELTLRRPQGAELPSSPHFSVSLPPSVPSPQALPTGMMSPRLGVSHSAAASPMVPPLSPNVSHTATASAAKRGCPSVPPARAMPPERLPPGMSVTIRPECQYCKKQPGALEESVGRHECRHVEAISSQKFQCMRCEEKFEKSLDIMNHYQQFNHGVERRPIGETYWCKLCKETVGGARAMANHFYGQNHAKDRTTTTRRPMSDFINIIRDVYFECDICRVFNENEKEIYRHIYTEHPERIIESWAVKI